ncbi:hypothetical protein ACVMGC_003603 [Bradyrhizobium barranii subsp. barranii]|uniref:Uncharacterized protein n=1 Tax=Bradyrhizobium barranii subsp. barranii TaxID=2823807 RepID=A0A939MEW9_9BRAD|nr:hypothetical protein [Bradyrhizobium barranii]UEM12003.1 hypothetical protein J4G43_047460 [Bradyrhizobium barranii subsp. barranii]
MGHIEATGWIAIYAAVVSTCAFALNFRTWIENRPLVHLSLMVDGMIVSPGSGVEEKDLTILTVTNRGRAPTMITNMVIFEMNSWWQRLRIRPEKSFVVANPQMAGYPPNVPGDLEPNKKWTGFARPRRDLLPDWPHHRYWVGVYVSHRDRPYLIRLPKTKPGPPENSKSV